MPHCAAAVVGPSGPLAAHGDTGRVFDLASLTKPLAALAVLVAVEEEAVSLEDPADLDTIPGATLRHLLAHASGYGPDQPTRAAQPGTRRIYSNAGVERAAHLVEQATGITFADYLDEAVIRPLGLTSTSLPGSAARDGRSSVADLTMVVRELLSPPRLLARPTREELATVQFPGLRGVLPGYGAQDPNDWGLGVEIRGSKSPHWTGAGNSPRTFGHFGQSGTMLWVDPDAQLALVALADRSFGPWAADAWPALSDAVLKQFG